MVYTHTPGVYHQQRLGGHKTSRDKEPGPQAGLSHRAEWGGIRVGPRDLGLFIFRYFSASKSPSPQVLLPSCPLTGSEMDTLPVAQLLWQVGTSEAEWTVLYPERPLPGRAPACLP